jgi:ribosomal-protein-alanine N-acetyltransferase
MGEPRLIPSADGLNGPASDSIRPLRPDDATAAARLEALCFPDPWSARALSEMLRSPTTLAFGGGSDTMGGYLIAQALLDECEILRVAVDPALRRRGLGRQLLERTRDHFAESLFRQGLPSGSLWLEVRADNAAAIGLYLGMGFESVGYRPRYYPDGCDARILRCSCPSISPPSC